MDIVESKELGSISDDETFDSDWYHESDTGEDIPDPNMVKKSLYQEANNLPIEL